MYMYTMDLKELIRQKRPEIKDNSIECYMTSINRMMGTTEYGNLRKLYKTDKIKAWLDKNITSLPTRRNYLSALCVGLSSLPRQTKAVKESLRIYREELLNKTKQHNEFINSHEQTDKQKKGWTTLEELKSVSNQLFLKVMEKELPYSEPGSLKVRETNLYMDYIISLFYTNPPLLPRLEISSLEVLLNPSTDDIKIFDEEKKNYIIWNREEYGESKMELVINTYKTDKCFGTRRYMLPVNMRTALHFYIKVCRPDIISGVNLRLFPKLTENCLGKRLTNIFSTDDRKTTLNTIRHIIISNSVDLEKEKHLKELAQQAGHSRSQQIGYAKYQ